MPEWTGFRNKTLWDFLAILFVPIIIALAAGVFSLISLRSEEQRERVQLDIEQRRAQAEREIEEDRAREAALQGYLDRMSELLLDWRLLERESGEPLREVARARTITILRDLDSTRNRSVLRFLHDADLMDKRDEPPGSSLVSLVDADLSRADLKGVILLNANLHGANLSRAELQSTDLQDSNLQRIGLSNAVLQGANLDGALLGGADLCSAFLAGANLQGADLSNAILLNTVLPGADLSNANLQGATFGDARGEDSRMCSELHRPTSQGGTDLRDANLQGANLTGSKITRRQLAQVKDLVGATMPDGTEMTEVRWTELKSNPGSD